MNRRAFCASCFNFIDSCDCLGNLEDHEHLNDFEREGKLEEDDDEDGNRGNDDDKVDGAVYYFRFQVGPTLDQIGKIGLGALLSMKEMWTTDPPDNPSLYMSIPKSRFPMDKVNINGQFPNKPIYVNPQHPWELQYFTLDNIPFEPEKTDAQIAKELKDCLKDAVKKKGLVRKGLAVIACNANALSDKAGAESQVSFEDLITGFKKTLPEIPPGVYYATLPVIASYTPPRLWKIANNAIVPGCAFHWIEMHLIDGSYPARDFDCSQKFASNVAGVDTYWDNNELGSSGPSYEDFYGREPTSSNQSRSLMLPYVPPPVEPPGQCPQWMAEAGLCRDDPPPPYEPPPVTKPPPGVVIPPEEIVIPPEEPPLTPLTDSEITKNINYPLALVQISNKQRVGATGALTWYNSGTTGFPDDRSRPHLSWGAAATPYATGDFVDKPVKLVVPERTYEFLTCFYFHMAHRAGTDTVYLKLTYNNGTRPNGMGFKVYWDEDPLNEVSKNGNSVTFSHTRSFAAGFDIGVVQITPLHYNATAGQEFDVEYITAWDQRIRPIFTRAQSLSWSQPNGGPAPTFTGDGTITYQDPANAAIGPRVTITQGARVDGFRVQAPCFSWGAGECVISATNAFGDSAAIHKMSNTGDGGITPVVSYGYKSFWDSSNAAFSHNTAKIPGSFGLYYGACLAWGIPP